MLAPITRFLVSDLLGAPITHAADKWEGTARLSMAANRDWEGQGARTAYLISRAAAQLAIRWGLIRWASDSYWQHDQMVAEVDERREQVQGQKEERDGMKIKRDHKGELTAAD